MVLKKTRQIDYLRANFAKWIKEGKVNVDDIEKIDFDAETDGSLQYGENKERLMSKYGYTDVPTEEEYELAESEHIKDIENEEEKAFKESIKKLSPADKDKHFKKLADMVLEVGKGYNKGLFAYGRGGLGKSFTVLKTLTENEVEYAIMKGYTTPLALYHTLYENNGKVIVLDDFHGVFSSKEAVAFLKSALDTTGNRMVSYNSTSDKLKVPSRFDFTGRLIVCSNNLPKNDTDFEALKSRALVCNVDFSMNEVKEMIMSIAQSGKELSLEERKEVAQYIIDGADESIENLTLRTLTLAYGRYKFSKENGYDWKEKVNELLIIDEDKKLMLEMLDKYQSVKDAQKDWSEQTGKSRATFYTLKKEIGKSREWKSRKV